MRLAATADVAHAFNQMGFRLVEAGAGRIEVEIDDRCVVFGLVPVAYATEARVRPLTESSVPDGTVIPLLVADRITSDARETLANRGWSYLDRRGHLRLRAPGILVETDLPSIESPIADATPDPLGGKAGLAVAYRLLATPDKPVMPTRSGTGFAPSTVSVALRRIRDAGLAEADGRPVLPDLFWALAERWRPRRQWLLGRPDPAEASNDPGVPGWCLTGSLAAAELGAPVVAVGKQLDLYVPGAASATIALRRHGAAPDPGVATASIAVAPVAAVTAERGRTSGSGWPLAHPVAVALDLAQDRARGREILDEWSPPERVW